MDRETKEEGGWVGGRDLPTRQDAMNPCKTRHDSRSIEGLELLEAGAIHHPCNDAAHVEGFLGVSGNEPTQFERRVFGGFEALCLGGWVGGWVGESSLVLYSFHPIHPLSSLLFSSYLLLCYGEKKRPCGWRGCSDQPPPIWVGWWVGGWVGG